MGDSITDIFTPPDLANEILDKLPKEVWEEDKTFLDPACGDGNLLVEIVKRKLDLGYNPTNILKSIYGVEIVDSYTKRCKERLLDLCGDIKEHRDIVDEQIITSDFLDRRIFSKTEELLKSFFD